MAWPSSRLTTNNAPASKRRAPHTRLAFRRGGCDGGLLRCVNFILMIAGGVGRQLNFRVSGVNDIVAWLCAASAFFAMAHSFKHGDFVRVTLVLEKLSDATRHRLDLISLSIAAVAVGYLSWSATAFTLESYEFAEMATGLVVIPIWIPQASFVVGCWLLMLAVLDEWWIVFQGGKPSYQLAVEQRHAKGDFSADV